MTTSDELDELFNMAINAKEIAVKTADEALEFADNSEIAVEANKLLDRYRVKFKEALHRLILARMREELNEARKWATKADSADQVWQQLTDRIEQLTQAIDNIAKEIRGTPDGL